MRLDIALCSVHGCAGRYEAVISSEASTARPWPGDRRRCHSRGQRRAGPAARRAGAADDDHQPTVRFRPWRRPDHLLLIRRSMTSPGLTRRSSASIPDRYGLKARPGARNVGYSGVTVWQAHRSDPPARGVRQHLLRRPQAQPPVHGREPTLYAVYTATQGRTGLTRSAGISPTPSSG